MTISFFAQGVPKGQPRPRAFARKFGDKWSARVYDAGTAEGWKAQVALAAKEYVPLSPVLGSIGITIEFFIPRPKAHFKSNGDLKPAAPIHHISKPDIENCAKAVLDCLTQLGFWRDDSQVTSLALFKSWAIGCAGACISIHDMASVPSALKAIA